MWPESISIDVHFDSIFAEILNFDIALGDYVFGISVFLVLIRRRRGFHVKSLIHTPWAFSLVLTLLKLHNILYSVVIF